MVEAEWPHCCEQVPEGRFFAPIASDSLQLSIEELAAMAGDDKGPRLCVVVPAGGGRAGEERLRAVLAVPAVACVILTRPGEGDGATELKRAVEQVQARGVAALIEADAGLARTLKADGVHLPWSRTLDDDYRTAREILDARAIVGAEAGSRHDAMSLGEAGASYVTFRVAAADDRAEALADRLDLAAWWAEIFEIPGIAFDVAEVADAAALIAIGIDFLGLEVTDTAGIDRLRAVAALLPTKERR